MHSTLPTIKGGNWEYIAIFHKTGHPYKPAIFSGPRDGWFGEVSLYFQEERSEY